MTGGNAAPEGWLICDGASLDRTLYPELYEAIGTAWGVGDGTATFNIPDLRGRFLRGVDNGEGNDLDAGSRTPTNGGNAGDNVGSLQEDAIRNITGQFGIKSNESYATPPFADIGASPGITNASGAGSVGTLYEFDASTQVPTGSDNRPVNMAVNYIIRSGYPTVFVADVTPNSISWVDFNGASTDKAFSGINQTINVELSASYGTGTPTIEYRINSGSYIPFTPGSPATIPINNGDTLGFKVDGAASETATITVTNLSDSNTILDTVTGTVFSVGAVGAWSSTLKDSTITLSTIVATNDTATSTNGDRRLVYGDLTTAGNGTYGTAKVYVEFILNEVGLGGAQDNQMVGFGVTAITPANFDPLNARGDCGFSLKFEGSQDLVFISPTDQFETIASYSGVPSPGDVIGIALDTVNETVQVWRNGITGGANDYTIGFDLGNDFTNQDIYVSAQLSKEITSSSEIRINSNPIIPAAIAGQGFTLI
jgi:microcystin-dependent protein